MGCAHITGDRKGVYGIMYEARKGAVTLHITDADGRPARNAKLHIEQTDHDFLFGCGAFDMLSLSENGEGDPFYEERAREWIDLFNYGTLSFYWGRYEPVEGKIEYHSRRNAANYLNKNGKKIKGHPLCWQTECAEWLLNYDNKTILSKQLERINRDVTAFADVIDYWDVINETVIMPVYDRYDNPVTRICKEYGRVNLVKEVLEAAKAADPDAVLLINDFDYSDRYAEVISDCLDAGAPIDAIGIQTHQHQGYWGRERLSEIISRFERFGLPIHFTENTFVSGHLMPPDIIDLNDYQPAEWPTTPEGEARQSRDLEDMLRFVFDHPLVEAFTTWDFTDGAWLGAPSGVVRKDNTKKPSYEMLKRLIHEEWHTAKDVQCDENGDIRFEGFLGTYAVTSEGSNAQFHFGKKDREGTITICLSKE